MNNQNTVTIGINLDTSQISNQVKNIEQILGKLNLPPELRKEFDSVFANFGKSLNTYQKKLQSGFKTKGDITGLERAGADLVSMTDKVDKFASKIRSMSSDDMSKMFNISPEAKQKIDEIDSSIKKLKEDLNSNVNASGLEKIDAIIQKFGSDKAKERGNVIKNLIQKGDVEGALAELDKMQQGFEKAGNTFGKNNPKIQATNAALIELRNALQSGDLSEISKISNDIQGLETQKVNIAAEDFQKFKTAVDGTESDVSNLRNNIDGMTSSTQQAAVSQQNLNSEIDQLGSRVKYFFSITNATMLLRRALQQAFNTVKELDAAMTETAVVTQFDVGDMWSRLPEYTERASALGVSIKDAYDAATLYYQQGLETNEVIALSNQTLKMGRIAGMEAADATDRMTAALRGFNMELNETSAERVADVYSQLAAITASNVDEISNAMTKTASIASNANMEFETTAAFLSQIIETTRESAETAGTALKTVIARFTELKKDPSEIGEVDGEIVDANKIETALRSVGVALRDEVGQFRDLDDVFIELASKWDSLDTNTQRYVATIAAGSRQQSRFIAMMSNYDRTMELVSAANNSAGASQRQYEKTLESLESKLAQLKNAWNSFILGITNSSIIKTGVDALKILLEKINKITDRLLGMASGLGKLLVAFLAFQAARSILNTFTTSLSISMASAGKVGAVSFSTAFRKEVLKKMTQVLVSTKNIFKKGTWVGVDPKAIASIELYNKNLAKTAQASALLDKMEEKGIATETRKARIQSLNAAYQKNMTDAEKEYAAAMGISESQSHTLLAAQSQGLSADWAATLAKSELTDETLKSVTAKITEAGIDLKSATISQLVAAGIDEETAAKILSNKTTQKGIAGRLIEIATKYLSAGASKKSGIATNFETWANKMAEKSYWSKTVAMLASLGIIGLIIIAVMALIALIVVLVKAISDDSYNAQLERAQEAVKKTAEEAEKAKDALDELLSAKSEYEELQDQLSSLSKGTEEWKEALVEVNDKVLELINNYPDLAKYLETGEYGQLQISNEGFDIIEQRQRQAVKNAQAANIFAQKDLSDLEAKKVKKENPSNYANFLEESKDIMTSQFAALFTGYVSEENLNYEYGTTAAQILSQQFVGNKAELEGKIAEKTTALKKGMDYKDSEEFMRLAKQFGLSESDMTGTDITDLKKVFAAAKGVDYDEIKDEKWNNAKKQAAVKELAEMMVTAEYGDQVNEIIDNLQEMSTRDQDLMNALVSKDTTKLSKESLKELGNLNKAELQKISSSMGYLNSEQMAKDLGYTKKTWTDLTEYEKKQAKEIFGDAHRTFTAVDMMILAAKDVYTASVGNIEKIKQILADSGVKEEYINIIKDLDDKFFNVAEKHLSQSQAEQYAANLSQISSRGGDVKAYSEFIKQIYSSAPEDKKEMALNTIMEMPIGSTEEIEKTIDALKDMGIEIEDGTLEALKDMTKSVRDFSLDSINETFSKGEKAQELFSDKEKRKFTEEEYLIALDAGMEASDFVIIGDEYYLLGETEQAINKIENYTANILAEMRSDRNKTIDIAQKFQDAAEADTKVSSTGKQIVSTSNEKNNNENYVINSNLGTNNNDYIIKPSSEYSGFTFQPTGILLTGTTEETYETKPKEKGEEGRTVDQFISDVKSGLVQDNAIKTFLSDTIGLKEYSYEYANLEGEELRNYFDELVKNYLNYDFLVEQRAQDYTTEYSQDSMALATKKDERSKTALQLKSDDLGVTNAEVEFYAKQLEVITDNTEEANKVGRGFANVLKEQENSLEAVSDTLDENIEALANVKDGTYEYEIRVGNLANAMSSAFNVDITSDFVKQHLSDIAAWRNGDIEAFNRIQQAMLEFRIEALNTEKAIIGNSENLVNAFDWLSANAIIGVAVDMTQLENLPTFAAEKIDEVTAMFANMNYAITTKETDDGAFRITGIVKTADNFMSRFTPKKEEDKEEEVYKNEYDWLYNLNEAINESLRERENLQTKLNQFLEDENITSQEITDNIVEQMQQLKNQQEMYKMMQKSRAAELQKTMEQNSDLMQYAAYNWDTQQVEIDWNAINTVTNADEGERIEEYISKLEDLQEGMEEVDAFLMDIEDQVKELQETGKQEYLDLEKNIYDAIVYEREQQIEKLEKINDSINNSNQKLIDNINKSLSKIRQDRDNKKTEETIEDTQAKLLYLSQDTSGMSELEVMKLQEQLDEQRQSYTDALIDQKISELEEQNTKAEEQRQQQIDILNSQLEYDKETGQIWKNVSSYMSDIKNGKVVSGSQLDTLLKNAANWSSLSAQQKKDWADDLKKNTAKAWAWTNGKDLNLENFDSSGVVSKLKTDISSGFYNLNTAIQEIDGGNSYYYYNSYGSSNTSEAQTDDEGDGGKGGYTPQLDTTPPPEGGSSYNSNSELDTLKQQLEGKKIYTMYAANGYYMDSNGEWVKNRNWHWVEGGSIIEKVIMGNLKDGGTYPLVKFKDYDGAYYDAIDILEKYGNKFETGGLADFTGPAWLDGTKSKPELVLNATDTQNFIQLKDILSSLMNDGRLNSFSTDSSSGDNYFDIDINVEELKDDYDVEQLAEKIKQDIVRDASYRNVNSINFLR